MSVLKEKSPSSSEARNFLESGDFAEVHQSVKMALQCVADKKAIDPVLLDLRGIADFTDFFIIVSGSSEKQVQAISDEIEERLKKELHEIPINIEGYTAAEWILMDYGDFIVHIFDKDAREFYDLERLWRDAKRITLPKDL
jgi:ribosome-associated protein